MKNKIVSILLFFCIVAPVTITFTILYFQKYQTRKEVKSQIISKIDKKELTLLRFTKTEIENKINWKDKKEFEYNGDMYDIVETKTDNENILFWCISDKKETYINKKIDTLLATVIDNNTQRKENKKILNTFLKALYFQNIKTDNILLIENQKIISSYVNNYKTSFTPPIYPPPKLV